MWNHFKIPVFTLCSVFLLGTPLLADIDSSQQLAKQIIESEKPVLIDFFADWCGPCHQLKPIIASLEKEYADKILFLRIDTDQHRQIAQYFRVQALPTVSFVYNSEVVASLMGVQPKEAYRLRLEQVLGLKQKNMPEKKADPTSETQTL